jgi:hypothetical protein
MVGEIPGKIGNGIKRRRARVVAPETSIVLPMRTSPSAARLSKSFIS